MSATRLTPSWSWPANRVVTVFGLGNIGKRAFDLARANGLTVQAVDIRARELSQRYGDDVKLFTKDEALRPAT